MFSGEVYRLMVFAVLAGVRTILELFLWKGLVIIGEKSEKIQSLLGFIKLNIYAASHGVSFIASVLASYFLNRYITFSDTNQLTNPELVFKFTFVSIITLIISVWLINFLTSEKFILEKVKLFNLINKHWPLLAKIATIGVTMLINYFGYRWFVFLV
jgi:putative flippase GtrA